MQKKKKTISVTYPQISQRLCRCFLFVKLHPALRFYPASVMLHFHVPFFELNLRSQIMSQLHPLMSLQSNLGQNQIQRCEGVYFFPLPLLLHMSADQPFGTGCLMVGLEKQTLLEICDPRHDQERGREFVHSAGNVLFPSFSVLSCSVWSRVKALILDVWCAACT